MRDELDGRLWADHHEEFSDAISAGLERIAARVRAIPHLAERTAGQLVILCLAVSIASALTAGTGLA